MIISLFNLKLNPIEQVETLPLNPLNGFPNLFWCIRFPQVKWINLCKFHPFIFCCRGSEILLLPRSTSRQPWVRRRLQVAIDLFVILQMDIEIDGLTVLRIFLCQLMGGHEVWEIFWCQINQIAWPPGRRWSCYAGPCSCAVTVERPPKSGAQVFG